MPGIFVLKGWHLSAKQTVLLLSLLLPSFCLSTSYFICLMMSLMVLNVPLSPHPHHRDPGAREVMNFPGIYLTMTRPSYAWDQLLWLTLG